MPPSPRAASDKQDADADDAGRVELEELHVLERHAVAVGQREPSPVSAKALEVIRNIRPNPPVANITAATAEDVQLAVGDAIANDAARLAPSSMSRSTTWYSSKNSTPCLMHCW